MIELPATPIQADAIRDASKARGQALTDWAMDCLLTYASNHLGRGLADWVALEREYVARGDYKVCGATNVVGKGTAGEHTSVCIRIKGHTVEAVCAREVHVGYMPDQQTLEHWQDSA